MVAISATMSNRYSNEGHRRSIDMGRWERENGGQVRPGKAKYLSSFSGGWPVRLKFEKHSHNASAYSSYLTYFTYEARNDFL